MRSWCRPTPPTPARARWSTRCRAGWPSRARSPVDTAVLARVQSLLLAPHVALAEAGVPVDSILDESVLSRLGVRAALAYLRIAVDPQHLSGADLAEVHRRPSRGLPQWAVKWLDRCRSVADVRQAATRIDDIKVAQKLDDLAVDLDRLSSLAAQGASARDLLTAVRDDIGLGSAMTLLDSSGGASGSHLDDLEALLQVADLHPDASSFEAWLRRAFHRERAEGGVTLSTIHRVKGREWDRVVVFGVTDGIVPHRLAEDIEEERRILHVGITRGRQRVLVLGDRTRRSRFLGELDGSAPHIEVRAAAATAPVPEARRPAPTRTTLPAEVGLRIRVLGGYEGDISAVEDGGVRLALDGGGSFFVRFGERVTHEGMALTLGRPPSPMAGEASAALRAWRLQRSRADAVPAYVVLSDKHLDGIAERHPTSMAELRACPGIGPAKLESYGEEILEVLGSIAADQPNVTGPYVTHRPAALISRIAPTTTRRCAAATPAPRARSTPACTSRGAGRWSARPPGSARHRRRDADRRRPPAPARRAPRRTRPGPPPHRTHPRPARRGVAPVAWRAWLTRFWRRRRSGRSGR